MTDAADGFDAFWLGITRDEISALSVADRTRFLAALRRHTQARIAAGDFTLSGRLYEPGGEQKAEQARRRRVKRLARDSESQALTDAL
ncbi:hypothetical protein AB4Z09_28825 [Rhodococcus sp. TAF43]|uniref:hypothetical protein n=1 Tax=Rhodococcus sp. TAF43 TaxID=3237483 RepID=UPI003F9A4EC3